MIIGIFLAAMENTLAAIEASGVIVLRMQIIAQGGPTAQTEAELMVTEKMKAFLRSHVGRCLRLLAGASI